MSSTRQARFGLLGLLLMLAASRAGSAQTAPVEDTAARRAADGFAASMLLTTDADWRARWNTPANATPEFSRVESVRRGTKIWLLVFFANARTDAAGRARIRCDIRFTRPDGKPAFRADDVGCYDQVVSPGTRQVHLAAQDIEFTGDPGDPTGTWRVHVTVRDQLRGTELALFTTFTLRE